MGGSVGFSALSFAEGAARAADEESVRAGLLRLMRVEKYGPASERLSDQQLELLEQEPGVSEAHLQLPLKRSKQRPARQSLPVELPRIEHRLKIPIRDYLASILPGLAELPVSRVAQLTPAAWM